MHNEHSVGKNLKCVHSYLNNILLSEFVYVGIKLGGIAEKKYPASAMMTKPVRDEFINFLLRTAQ